MSQARVLFDYTPHEFDDEMSIQEGEILEVMSYSEEDWWKCRRKGGPIGLVPKNYLEVLPDEKGCGKQINSESQDHDDYNSESGFKPDLSHCILILRPGRIYPIGEAI
jgi:hypothetical protein